MNGIKIALLVQELRQFCCMGGLCLLVKLHREGSAPAACAAGLFFKASLTNTHTETSISKYLRTHRHTDQPVNKYMTHRFRPSVKANYMPRCIVYIMGGKMQCRGHQDIPYYSLSPPSNFICPPINCEDILVWRRPRE